MCLVPLLLLWVLLLMFGWDSTTPIGAYDGADTFFFDDKFGNCVRIKKQQRRSIRQIRNTLSETTCNVIFYGDLCTVAILKQDTAYNYHQISHVRQQAKCCL
ncbi:hypothetical protein BCR42DRAFT_491592 [Absidia repens]|uniref:Secreted protein n=1 Tax=Absidia repens TaxID=90262 RepID=A0A1X2IHF3_9FUNG|nr:hypothetical protein BCR42DRAFT_491592 [Absidia repens]